MINNAPVDALLAPRPKLSRFDRPAVNVEELMRPSGEYFVYLAYWTLINRRPTKAELQFAARKLNNGMHRIDLLLYIKDRTDIDSFQKDLPGLRLILSAHCRAQIPIIGQMLVKLHRWWTYSLVMQNICIKATRILGGTRQLYRRRLRGALRQGVWLRSLVPNHIFRPKAQGHLSAAADMSSLAVELYLRICDAIDRRNGIH